MITAAVNGATHNSREKGKILTIRLAYDAATGY